MGLYAFDGTKQDDRGTGSFWEAVAADTNIYRFHSAYEGYARSQGIASNYIQGVGTRCRRDRSDRGRGVGRRLAGSNQRCACHDVQRRIWRATTRSTSSASAAARRSRSTSSTRCLATASATTRAASSSPSRRSASSGCSTPWPPSVSRTSGFLLAQFNPLHHLLLPDNIEHCYHAMSLDERRPAFVNQRIVGAYEVWFRGVHSDIGGGNTNPALEYVALRWMCRKAIACGLPITEANITDSAVHPETRIKPELLQRHVSKCTFRTVRDTDTVHYAVGQHPALEDEPCNKRFRRCARSRSLEFEKTRIVLPAAATT